MKEYIVKKGDSLWGICRSMGVSIDAVARINGFTPQSKHHLDVGQVIKIEDEEINEPIANCLFIY
ncbi:LysM peptidoglycan-binding domain-containing protein [Iodobacter ciconiae]|uniref:LysM peptidoglycan-binding domain-containing protein n=1 Tax=Iodobacter ciconiae TaxID=2496266 RepID=A0A3S8ZTQ0_9NEIS|nr:LysM peptidoglycan-binding domain-containing protein [Iodobacter ciconiae]AZN36839.1 LysM peptidoglycan-binding domain-containing protein [Iodobacter ciconiae]